MLQTQSSGSPRDPLEKRATNHVRRPKLALVDPIRTARALIGEVGRRGLDLVIVESGLVGSVHDDAHETLRAPTVEAMAEIVRKAGATQVIACVDPSIPYADALCAQLGVVSNGLRLSAARRNKALMNAAVRRAGLRAPAQFETGDAGEFEAWLRSAAYPLVVKPVASGGTDNVHLCETEAQAKAAFEKIFDVRNLMGLRNSSVLAQEYIDGIEYVVDSVSFDGVHIPVDLFQYQKGVHNGRAFIYEKEFYMRAQDPRSRALVEFATRALDALEFRVGASHMELKINSAGEVAFIEVGARLNGGDTYKLVQDTRADGRSQLEISVDAATGGPPPDPEYRTARDGMRAYIVSSRAGRLAALRRMDEIEGLRSFRRKSLHVEVGKDVVKTTDLTNDAGWFDLAHADPAVLREDERRLDEILKDGVLVYE